MIEEAPPTPPPAAEVHWTVRREDAGRWQPVEIGGDLLHTPRRFTYRYKAAHAAVAALFDGADAVAIDRHPPLQ